MFNDSPRWVYMIGSVAFAVVKLEPGDMSVIEYSMVLGRQPKENSQSVK